MVFGHQTTSHNLSISNNVFLEAGCIQTRGDRAAIAFTCPNHNKVLDQSLIALKEAEANACDVCTLRRQAER